MLAVRRSDNPGGPHDPDKAAAARPLGYMYLVAAALGPATLLAPHYPVIDSAAVMALSVVAMVMGGGLLLCGSRFSTWSLHASVALGALLTGAAIHSTGGVPNSASLLYVWIALYAFYSFPRGPALAQMALVGGSYAVAIVLRPPPFPVTAHWITTMTTLMTAGLLVSVLKKKVDERTRQLDRTVRDTRRILDTAQDAFVSIDGDGIVVEWNDAAERIFGWSRSEALGREMAELIVPPNLRSGHRDGLAHIQERGHSELLHSRVEMPALHRGGHQISVEIAMSATTRREAPAFNAFIRDVTTRKRIESYVAAQLQVTRVLAEAATWEAAEERLLAALGGVLGWEVGGVWKWDEQASLLRCSRVWAADGVDVRWFARESLETTLSARCGLPGRVWREAKPGWLPDIATDSNFPRKQAASRDGLRTAIALPVVSGDAVLAVLEFFTRSEKEPDPALLDMLINLGSQIGQFYTRKLAERELLDEAELRSAVARVTKQLSRASDPATARVKVCELAAATLESPAAWLFEPDSPDAVSLTASAGSERQPAALPAGACEAAVRSLATRTRITLAASVSAGSAGAAPHAGVVLEPLVARDRVIGVLAVEDPRSGRSDRFLYGLGLLAREAIVGLERVDLLQRLRDAARTDALTGLANRRGLTEELEREIVRARRARVPLTVAIVDIDHFKLYNDAHGHQAGDRLLREAAAAWRDQLRATDTLGRYGGEEFVAVLPQCPAAEGETLIERLRDATPLGVTCSAGVASLESDESSQTLLARADAALYRAKLEGRDRTVAA